MDEIRRSKRVTVALAATLVPSAFFGSYQVLSRLSENALTFIIGVESLVSLVALAVLNTRVGYRKRDIALLVVPVYGIIYLGRILWRGSHLPDNYWAPELVNSDLYRYAAFSEFVQLGVSKNAASMLALTMFPIDDDIPASESFTNLMYEQSLVAADAIHASHVQDLEDFAVETLQRYVELAHDWNEPYYSTRYGTAIDEARTRPAPSYTSDLSSVENLHSVATPEAEK